MKVLTVVIVGFFFFFQAEDGIRDRTVTGVQTCALPICGVTYPIVEDGSGMIGDRYGITGVPETYFIDRRGRLVGVHVLGPITDQPFASQFEIGRASCRERVKNWVGAVGVKHIEQKCRQE